MKDQIHYRYLTSWVITIAIGTFLIGYSLSSFNILTNFMYFQYRYNNVKGFYLAEMDLFNSIVTAIVPIGAAIGSIFGGKFACIGRRLAMILLSICFIFGTMITLVFNFYFLILGKFIIGIICGVYSVIVPLFINEITPVSISGSLGAINQIMLTLSVAFVGCLGFIIPYESEVYMQIHSKVWITIFLIPVLFAVLQITLLLLVFKHDTPTFYSIMNLKELEREAYKLIYKQRENEESDGCEEVREECYSDLLIRPLLKPFVFGCCLSIIQQLTGINCIIFYSNDIFTLSSSGREAEVAAKIGTCLVGFANFIASLCVIPLLNYFGRKSMMMFAQCGMILCYFLLCICTNADINYSIEICTLIFICFYQLGIGPILWIYLSETMTAKGLGIAALLNWIVIIMISFATPFMFSDLPTEFVYGFLMSLCFIGLIFINKYIIETKGLTRNQILQKISGYQVMDEISMHKDFEIKTKSNFIQY